MKNFIDGQQDIFSVFGIVDEYAEQKKHEEEMQRQHKAEELRKKMEKASSSTETTKKEEAAFEVNEFTVIRYFGESIDILTYFSPEEISDGVLIKNKDGEKRKKIDGETLRKRMEKDYPELVKGMTEMIFLKDKNIVIPVMKAKKKGSMGTPSLMEGVSSSLPIRIPFSILREFISVAKLFGEFSLEVHADIYYFPKTGKFLLDFPAQRVSKYWCEVTESAASIAQRVGMGNSVKIMEIHSHHMLAPVPSVQDDLSERVPGMLYGIIGFTHKVFPEVTIRKYTGSGWEIVLYRDVFEDPFFSVPPTFQMDKIEVVSE